MLTLYSAKGDAVHVLPLPLGLALALFRRPGQAELRRRKRAWSERSSPARDCLRTDTRFAGIRQRFV